MNGILSALTSDAPQTLADWRAIWMAGELLLLYRRAFRRDPSRHDARIVKQVTALVTDGLLAPRERVAAADVLAELADTRAGVGVNDNGLPDLLFCEIPPGDFLMGDTLDVWGGEKEILYTKLKQPYYITRYAITNAQFDAFLKADDGFRNAKWWEGLADTDNRSFPEKQGGAFDLPNHPVVNVTWYQAAAFCNWLNEKLKAQSEKLKVWRNDGIETFSF